MRLACKRLASLGASMLLDTIYISPHSKNMETFESIVHHPVISRSVKHIVYDAVRFELHSPETYFRALLLQLQRPLYKRIRHYDPAVRYAMARLDRKGFKVALPNDQNPHFMNGYSQYLLFAREERVREMTDPWFAIICRGLQRLGPIHSATVRNTWDMIYDKDIRDDLDGDLPEYIDDSTEDSRHPDAEDDEWEDCGSSVASSLDLILQDTRGLGADGTRLLGSPLARTWPPSWLQPPSSDEDLQDRMSVCGSGALGYLRSVNYAFNFFIRLLAAAGKQPRTLQVPGNDDGSHGLNPYFLYLHDPLRERFFGSIPKTLTSLHLVLTSVKPRRLATITPILSLLKIDPEDAMSLKDMRLVLPIEIIAAPVHGGEDENDSSHIYKSNQVFSRLPGLNFPNLCVLHLRGIEIKYHELVGLLFTGPPHRRDLQLSYLKIVGDGYWEDIVEGLRCLCHLESCVLRDPLLYPNHRSYTYQSMKPHDDFLDANSRYIMQGGRHPALAEEELTSSSTKYWERLKSKIDEVKKTTGANTA
ncbi:MAG: hypothetical protein Q9170_005307 [Blastenia crenularia]